MASPATTIVVDAGRPPSTGSIASTDGGSVTWVMSWAAASSESSGPGSRRQAGARTSVPPVNSAMATSQKAASKLAVANCSTRLSGPTAQRSIWLASRLGIPVWQTTTPLGRPVDPEV